MLVKFSNFIEVLRFRWRASNVSLLAAVFLCVGFFNTLTQAQPYGLTNRPSVAPFLNGAVPRVSPVVSGDWSAVQAFPNLIFTNAVGLTFVPGSSNLCVWEREGRVWTFLNNSNVSQRKLVLDISNQCQGWDDSGLLGLAFHPGFATNRFMFVYYTWVVPGTVQGDPYTRPPVFSAGTYHDRLVRYTLDTNGVALPASEMVLVDIAGDSPWHNGGGMFFHPTNGFLYWTDGDDADVDNSGIITNSLFAGVFRIDVDKRGGSISHPIPRQPLNGFTTNYFIPNDNPFVGQSNALEEFFCLGLRSPHRMTIDPPTGRIFIGDVGQSSKEEISIIEPGESGLNFQWPQIEGFGGDLAPPFIGINRRPALDYPHTDGNFAVIGGYVYRGSQFASDLAGKYIFGDNGSRIVWVMDESTVPAGKIPLCTVPQGGGPNSGNDYTGLSSFGVDAAGEIYMCQMSSTGGQIYKLSRSGPVGVQNPPALFSQLGAFTNLVTLAPAAFVIPYTVNSPLWSDGAHKQRWLVVPTNTTVGFAATNEWAFPPGSVFFKNFELSTNENNPAQRRRLETRLLVRDTNGTVYGATYKWRANNTEADLITLGTNENILITTATGVRTQVWYYPGRSDCLRCHNPAAGGVLGATTRQLNGNLLYPSGVTDNQLRALNNIGIFSTQLVQSAISGYPRMAAVTDTNFSLETRARSYFDANCAHCHRPGGVSALFDMRFDTPLAQQALVNGYALNPLGVTDAKIIKPSNTSKSVLYLRDSSLGTIQMPPLAKNIVDTNAMSVIAAWINSLPPASQTLPAPWRDASIGVTLPGNVNVTNGSFELTGAGLDFWANADNGYFVYQPMVGNGLIQARITGVQYTDPWAKAGLTFRESLATGARNVMFEATGGNGMAYQSRTNTGGDSFFFSGPYVGTPYWARIARSGNVFTFWSSPDGVAWSLNGTVTNAMSTNTLVGMVVSSRNNTVYNTSSFDNVSLVFSNGQPLYVAAGANVTATTATQQTLQFNAQAFAGRLSTNLISTTDVAPGTISAQGENSAFGEIAANAFDNNSATKWLDFANANPSTRASWIQFRYPGNTRYAVSRYVITSANDAPERDPKNWRILGSNDNGTNWTTLDIRLNETFSGRFQPQTYTFVNSTAYNLYRLQIDSVNSPLSANSVQLAEIEFDGSATASYLWDFGDGSPTSNLQNPARAYTASGNYTATVIASDGFSLATNSVSFLVALATSPVPLWVPSSINMAGRQFRISAQVTPSNTYVIEATTNLRTWAPIFTNYPVGGLLNFTDAASTNIPSRFYRLRTP